MTRGDQPLPTEERRELYTPRYATRVNPQTPPTVGAFDFPTIGCCINVEWMAHILGSTASLEWSDAWKGTPEEKQFALDQIVRIQDAMTCRCGVGTTTIITNVVEEYRFKLELEFNLNGLDGVAPERPDTFFDEDSGDVGDDIILRENALCLACEDYVNTHLANMQSFAQSIELPIVGGILPVLFEVGMLAGVVSTMVLLVTSAAIIVALQDTTNRQEIVCCMVDGLKGKAVNKTNFENSLDNCDFAVPSIKDAVREIISATLNDQGNWLSFIRALGAYFSYMQFDVFACFCQDLGKICDFILDRCGFEVILGPNGPEAEYEFGKGWKKGPSGVVSHFINIKSNFSEDISFTKIRIFTVNTLNNTITYTARLFDGESAELFNESIVLPKEATNHQFEFSEITGVRRLEVQILKGGLTIAFPGHLTMVQVEADPAPFPLQES